MPEQFDPRWEYWEPDPEIAEAMGTDRLGTLADLGFESDDDGTPALFRRFRKGDWNPGFRLGWGVIDGGIIDANPPPPVFDEPVVRVVRVECHACQSPFTRTKNRKIYCRTCQPQAGGRPPLAERECEFCRGRFKPTASRHSSYCSPRCGGMTQTAAWHDSGCPVCGAAVPPGTRGPKKLYCTRRCMKVAANRRLRGNFPPVPVGTCS